MKQNPKPIILAIVGESGSGKTTLSQFLERKLGIPAIVSYTTRPMRPGEVDGKDHYFVGDSAIPVPSETFAYTFFAGNHYWTTLSQFKGHRIVSYVVDEKGLLDMERWSGDCKIISILIKRPVNPVEQERKDRDKERIKLDEAVFDVILTNEDSKSTLYRQAILKLSDQISTNLIMK